MKAIHLLILFLFPICTQAQVSDGDILSMRDRAEWIDNMLEYRLDSLLPVLMDRSGIDMWILISRESEWLSARRRTIMVFHKPIDEQLEKIAIARYSVGRLLKGEWNVDVFPNQWEALITYIKEKDPKKIGLNYSDDFGLADGLVSTEYQSFMKYLPEEYHKRVVSAEYLSINMPVGMKVTLPY